MDKGKVRESILDRSVFKIIEKRREEILYGAGIAQDASVISMTNNEVTVISTNPVTYNFAGMAALGVAQAVNGVAAQGGQPVGMMMTILMPERLREIKLKNIMRETEAACAKENVQICVGHTDVTDNVINPVISFTCVGKAPVDKVLSAGNIKLDMDIIMTKWIAMAGTVMMLNKYGEQLESRFQRSFLDRMKNFPEYFSCVKEAAVAVNSGVVAMHDAGLGGIKGALWEIASAANVGIEVSFDRIRVKQETIEICEYLGLNPYDMCSTGVMIMAAEDGAELAEKLCSQGIEAEVIGRTTESNDRVLVKNEESRFLTPPRGDEIYKDVKGMTL